MTRRGVEPLAAEVLFRLRHRHVAHLATLLQDAGDGIVLVEMLLNLFHFLGLLFQLLAATLRERTGEHLLLPCFQLLHQRLEVGLHLADLRRSLRRLREAGKPGERAHVGEVQRGRMEHHHRERGHDHHDGEKADKRHAGATANRHGRVVRRKQPEAVSRIESLAEPPQDEAFGLFGKHCSPGRE